MNNQLAFPATKIVPIGNVPGHRCTLPPGTHGLLASSCPHISGNIMTLRIIAFHLCLSAFICGLSPAFLVAADAKQGMVVSSSVDASDAGVEILKRGGTAVDAAVCVGLTMAVTFPEAGNIGGGGFMMVLPAQGEPPVCIEYRETAPGSVNAQTFINDTASSGHRTVGVPGTVRGLALAHKRYGKLPWRELVLPAVKLARDGFAIDRNLATALNNQLKTADDFPEFKRVFGKPGGGEWSAGDKLVQPDLAKTMQTLAGEGPEAFYRGKLAEQFVAEMKAGGGLITLDDLANYQAVERTPIRGTYRGYEIFGPPPPSSGGTVVVEVLNILENFDLKQRDRWSAETMHLVIEAMKRTYCDRARYLGDPSFSVIPDHLTSKEHAKQLAATIDLNRATPSEKLAPELTIAPEGESTTHFSVVDGHGMAVSNTYTLQNSYGSKVVVRGGGYLLNNEMTDFNWRPGVTDRSGRIGTAANTVAPGKRMLSSQSPTLVLRDGKLILVTGSPGGRTIPNTVLSVVLGVTEFGLGVREAVDAPRIHHQWLPDRLNFEKAEDPKFAAVLSKLRAMGHVINERDVRQGDANSIMISADGFTGAADSRRTWGKAAGY